MIPTILAAMLAAAGVLSQPVIPQLDWALPTPVTRSTSVALTADAQPGTRLYFIDPVAGVNPASGVYYLWDGTRIIDSTGSATGAGGVAYGTDPLNPSGPVVAWRHWAAVCPTREGLAPGVRTAAAGFVWNERFDTTTGRPQSSPDWWLFKRGTELDLAADLDAYRVLAPGVVASAIDYTGLAIPGGSSVSARQIVGSYGPTAAALPRIWRSVGGAALINRQFAVGGIGFTNAIYQDLFLDRPGTNAMPGLFVLNAATRDVSDVLFQGVVFRRFTSQHPAEQGPGDVRFFRCVFVDHCTPATSGSHTAAVHCSHSTNNNAATLGRFITLEECFIARNGFKYLDPNRIEGGEFAGLTNLTTLPGSGTVGDVVKQGGELWVRTASSWEQCSDLGGTRARGTIFDRNLYLSHQAKLLRCTILRGGSGEQLRVGSLIDGCYIQAGYLNFGRRYTSDATPAGSGIYRSIIEGVSQWSNAAHLNGQITLLDGLTGARIEDNILTKAAIPPGDPDYYETLRLVATGAADGTPEWTPQRATQGNVITGNIIETRAATLCAMVDGPTNGQSFAWPGLVGNSIVGNTLVGTNTSATTYMANGVAGLSSNTTISGNTGLTGTGSFSAPGRTWKTYLQSLGVTVTSVDGVHEAVQAALSFRRGAWDSRYIGLRPVNHVRGGWGKVALGSAAAVNPAVQSLFFDGNSFLDTSAALSIASVTRAKPFGLTFQGMQNIGIGGQTIANMTANNADLQAMVASGLGVLIAVEITNSVFKNGRQPAQALSDLTAYSAYVRSIGFTGPLLVCGTIPRYQATGLDPAYANLDTMNAALVSINTSLAASPGTYGFNAFVDLRGAGGPYAFTDYSLAGFQANAGGYVDGDPLYVHPSATGAGYIADRVVATLQSLA